MDSLLQQIQTLLLEIKEHSKTSAKPAEVNLAILRIEQAIHWLKLSSK